MIEWVIQQGVFLEEQEIIDTLKKMGIKYYVLTGDEFGNFKYAERNNTEIFFYGSTHKYHWVKRNTRWLISDIEQYKCSYYYPRYNMHLLNHDAYWIPIGCFLYQGIGKRKQFIKPDTGMKKFEPRIICSQDSESIHELSTHEPSEMILVSSPKVIDIELRYFLCKERGKWKILDFCQYKHGGETSIVKFSTSCAKKVIEWANVFSPDINIYIMDTCFYGGKWNLLEINSINHAGWYTCDKKLLIESINEMVSHYATFQEYGDKKK